MVRITTATNSRYKRFFHNCTNGKTERVCRRCGVHIHGRNVGARLACLAKQKGKVTK